MLLPMGSAQSQATEDTKTWGPALWISGILLKANRVKGYKPRRGFLSFIQQPHLKSISKLKTWPWFRNKWDKFAVPASKLAS